jgi:hypothetical protein
MGLGGYVMFLTMLLINFLHEDWSARCCEVVSQDRAFTVLTGDYRSLPAGATGLEIGAEVIEGDGWTNRDAPCSPVGKWSDTSDERVTFEIKNAGVTPPMNGFGGYNLVLPPGWRFDALQVDNPNHLDYIGREYVVARDDKGNREAVMLYFQGANSRFSLVVRAARGSRDSDSHELGVSVDSRHIVEPSPMATDTQGVLEGENTHSRSAIAPPSQPVPAGGIDVQHGPATETQVQANNMAGLAATLGEPSEGVTGLEEAARSANQLTQEHYADASYESVAAALNEAIASGAISEGSRMICPGFRVRIGHPLDGLRLTFEFGYGSESRGPILRKVATWSPRETDTDFVAEWLPNVSAAVVFDSLRRAHTEAWLSEEEFDVSFALRNLFQSLEISTQARRGQRPRPRNRVIEIVGDRWAFTEAGLESLTNDFALSHLRFPKRWYNQDGVDPDKYKRPRTPPSVDKKDWRALMLVAERIYPWPAKRVFPSL